ncbi:SusC/RagA family TonB-linked outer membrane protein [Chitinophaga arvensicola]|uniref:TonB-linked outer membrane protein, SusC/RagA family n=1 Tax=Chitinophaga arvensicola TaxID=29529 RepID=A0A1I0R4B9_9BACT|nr:SusC/RagA family TonB-linked outer membrane protein [Chitinophaga arvensicola]SEW35378.1 TonB-linked outer membrane protein, SusC/RagA family [Chitinophaga arvensicola]
MIHLHHQLSRNFRHNKGGFKLAGYLLSGLLFLHGALLAQTVNLSVRNAPLEKVCKEIEKQTGYYFVYGANLKASGKSVSVDLKDAPVGKALSKVFEGSSFQYEVIDKVISVNTSAPKKQQEASAPVPDTMSIDGVVYGSNALLLENATVRTLQSKKLVLTNASGKFHLKGVYHGEILAVSYMGYQQQQMIIRDDKLVAIFLKPAENQLDNVVVRAYGKTSTRFATGSISTVTAKELANQPVLNPMVALQGKVPGLVITTAGGSPSAPIKIEIRGRNSLNGKIPASPLVIVDGVPLMVADLKVPGSMTRDGSAPYSAGLDQSAVTQGVSPFFGINPNDIESITVLKDADATAIYGSRGSNGVILINTKTGKIGTPIFTAAVSQGITKVTRFFDMLNTTDYLQMRREAFLNDGLVPSTNPASKDYAEDMAAWDPNRNVDWQKLVFGGTGKYTSVNADYSGGTRQTTFRVAGNYNKTSDITNLSGGDQAAGISMNINNNSSNDKLRVGMTASYIYTQSDVVSFPFSIASLAPNAPGIYDETGSPNFKGYMGKTAYPFSAMLMPTNSQTNRLNSNFTISYNILKGLTLDLNMGYGRSDNNSLGLKPMAAQQQRPGSAPIYGTRNVGRTLVNNLIAEPKISYNTTIGQGSLNIMTGATYQSNTTSGLTTVGDLYTSDDMLGSLSFAPRLNTSEGIAQYKYAGVFGRIEYNLQQKYMLSLTGRRDGSSRFGPGKQFGNFGSIGGAWIMSEESWAHLVLPKAISTWKLRASYGLTGSDGVGDYQYLEQWANPLSGNNYVLEKYMGITPLFQQLQPNDQFHWETNKKLSAALEMGLLKDRLNVMVEWYRNRCDNQLIGLPTGLFTGFNSVTMNSPANVQNTGWEIYIGGDIIRNQNWNWSASFNTNIVNNKLLSYPDLERSPYAAKYKVGYSINNDYVYHFIGIDPQTGIPLFFDQNKDGKITYNAAVPAGTADDDRVTPISTVPPFYGGFSTSLRYKSFGMTANFYYKKFDAFTGYGSNMGTATNVSYQEFNGRWTHPGQVGATSPKVSLDPEGTYAYLDISDRKYTRVNMFRAQSLQAFWKVPLKWIMRTKMKEVSLNVATNNLFLITDYVGIDPEIPYSSGRMPPTRTVTIGVNCKF